MKNFAKFVCQLLIASTLLLPGLSVEAKTVQGVNFGTTLSVGGKTLKLVGAGTRVKWFVNVYAMGAYSASGQCNSGALMNQEEAKSLLLVMLMDVGADKMTSTISEAFKQQMPSNASATLKKQHQQFETLFKKSMTKGTKLQFDYLPGKGMTIKQNNQVLGTMAGSEFAKVFFKIYFSSNNCCPELSQEIMKCTK